jgi:hypothetical protein
MATNTSGAFPSRTPFFVLQIGQTGTVAHPASYSSGIIVLSRRQSDRVVHKLTTNLHLGQRFKKKYRCKVISTVCLRGVDRDTFFFTDYGVKGANLWNFPWPKNRNSSASAKEFWTGDVITHLDLNTTPQANDERMTQVPLWPYLSICFSSRNPIKATELTEEPLPVNNKSNINLSTSISLLFMHITCKKSKANLGLIDNLIASPDTSTVHGDLCWLTALQNREASGLKQRLTDCVLSVTEPPHEF